MIRTRAMEEAVAALTATGDFEVVKTRSAYTDLAHVPTGEVLRIESEHYSNGPGVQIGNFNNQTNVW